MKKRLTRALLVILSAMLIFTTGAVGCADEPKGYVTALPHHQYDENQTGCDYNTDLFYRNQQTPKLGDPTTIYIDEGEWKGWFYTTGTNIGTGFTAYRSKDFVSWEAVPQPILLRAENHFGVEAFWAPQYYWDAEARYEDYNIVKEEGEDGTGLYFLFYSALTATGLDTDFTDKSTANDKYSSMYYPAVAISKSPAGPFYEYEGTNADGLEMDASTPLFNIEYVKKYNPDVDKDAQVGQEIYKYRRSFIDACPFVDPVTGDKYLYMARNRKNDTTNEIWGVKMKDWVTPDYTTVSRLTSFGYTTTKRDELYAYGYHVGGNIDEGPFTIYNEESQKYYLTFSVGGTSDKLYPVMQAVGDSPLGPFEKVQPNKGGVVCSTTMESDINGSGHHCFFTINGELWIAYHSYPLDPYTFQKQSRGLGLDRVRWHENEDGLLLMHANGPTKTMTPLPEMISGYKNVALQATATATGGIDNSYAKYLNDDLIKMNECDVFDDQVEEFSTKGTATMTLKFDKPVYARAIMIYNTYTYEYAFDEVKRVEFTYIDEEDGKEKIAYINDMKFDIEGNRTPLAMFFDEEEIAEMSPQEKEENLIMRAGGAVTAEFDELKITKVKVTVSKPKRREYINISEIVILGRDA